MNGFTAAWRWHSLARENTIARSPNGARPFGCFLEICREQILN